MVTLYALIEVDCKEALCSHALNSRLSFKVKKIPTNVQKINLYETDTLEVGT